MKALFPLHGLTALPLKMNRKVLFFAAALSLTGCRENVSIRQSPIPSEPVTVKVQSVKMGSAKGITAYVGTVSAEKSATLTSPVPGTLESLQVREGTSVKKGQVLGKISSQAVESSYKAASSRLSQAEDGLRRVQTVYDSGALAEVEYIKIKTQVEEARAAEAAARDARDRCNLKAPFSGVVEHVWPSEGMELSLAQPILSIVDLGSLEAHFSVPENEYHMYAEGTSATVEIPAIGKTLGGRLKAKSLTASALSRSYDCTVSIPAGTEIMPGMVCKVRLSREGGEKAVVPASAVMTDTRGRYVWTATGGTVDKKYVTLGGFSGDGIVISDGLQEGDLVIVEGARKVSTGMKVKTIE